MWTNDLFDFLSIEYTIINNTLLGLKIFNGINIFEEYNEFLIEKRDPLTLPPDYSILPPDSNAKPNKNKKSTDSLKSIFDKDLNSQKKSSSKTIPANTKGIENEILKQIK